MPAGRPSKYDEKFNEIAYKYCAKNGASDVELAELFSVAESTIYEWKENHPAFSESIKRGKREFDTTEVEKALVHNAIGYSHEDEQIFCYKGHVVKVKTVKHYPPNPTSQIFWLKNRNPEEWKDKQEVEHSGNLTPVINIVTNEKNDK